jgi:hypothetical protein
MCVPDGSWRCIDNLAGRNGQQADQEIRLPDSADQKTKKNIDEVRSARRPLAELELERLAPPLASA